MPRTLEEAVAAYAAQAGLTVHLDSEPGGGELIFLLDDGPVVVRLCPARDDVPAYRTGRFFRLAIQRSGSYPPSASQLERIDDLADYFGRLEEELPDELVQGWFLQAEPELPPEPIPPRAPNVSATLKISSRCNLDCTFCAERPYFDTFRELENEDRLRSALDGLHARGVRAVCFDGGEPTLSPALEAGIRYARHLDFEDVALVTNGIRLARRDRLERLRDAGLNAICISFHAPDSVLSERLHRRDVLRLQLQALENAASLPDLTVTQQTVLIAENEHALPAILERGRELADIITINYCHARLSKRAEPQPLLACLDDDRVLGPLEQFRREAPLPLAVRRFPYCVLSTAFAREQEEGPSLTSSASGARPNAWLCPSCKHRLRCRFPLLVYLWQRRGRRDLLRATLRRPRHADALSECFLKGRRR